MARLSEVSPCFPACFYLRSYQLNSGISGETIPIRLFLGGFELTPTFRDVNKKFSTRYYLNLVLVDEENRRYFKSSEITIFRCVFLIWKPGGSQAVRANWDANLVVASSALACYNAESRESKTARSP